MNLGPRLETPRLVLRPHRLGDYEDVCVLTCDPEAVRMIFQKPLTREETWHRMLRFVGHWAAAGRGESDRSDRRRGRPRRFPPRAGQ
jgi:RimJ/RimL family protein N-acetyltransferase